VCKLIKAKGGVLSLMRTTEYVNEIVQASPANPVDEAEERRLRIHVMETR